VKKLAILLPAIFFILSVNGQTYWQQQVNYLIDVTLNDKEKTLDAFEKIDYTNNSPDTLHYIWFHLWPNAYKNDQTAFSEQLLENGSTRFYFSDKEERGYINRLSFKVDGTTANTEDHPLWIDVVKVVLPKPLPPKGQIQITTPFHVKLPYNISRGGYDGETFQVTQWYPKPAVYDQRGWHPMPYLDQGEFYSEFGSFDVRISLPSDYVIAATGELQNQEEKNWLKTRNNYTGKQEIKKTVPVGKKSKQSLPGGSSTQKTLRFVLDNIHDFAWFANKDFIVNTDTCALPSGKIVDVSSYYTTGQQEKWKNSVGFAKEALRFYSDQVGEYPYNIASVVQGPESFGGGMEYPTITIISPTTSAEALDLTIAHELGHNWFYGILASNERQHPWMDEGMNTFYASKYQEKKYHNLNQGSEILFQSKAIRKTDQPIETTSENFSELNYNLIAYHKTSQWLKLVEERIGAESFKVTMQEYFKTWSFRHPQPEDFKVILGPKLGSDSASLFSLLNQNGILPGKNYKGSSIITPLSKSSIKNYLNHPPKHGLILTPAVGFNSYDKFMIGGLITNYTLPPSKFNFLLIPLYGTGSKSFAGLGKLNYSITSSSFIRKTDLFINASTFSINQYEDVDKNQTTLHLQKLVPGIRLTFKEKNSRSIVLKYLQWKTFGIREDGLHIYFDTTITGTDTTLNTRYYSRNQDRYLNQLQFVYQNNRALYPYDITFQMEQGKEFLRPTATVNYFFNYPKGGGLDVRFFAGKFIYIGEETNQKKYRNDRYQLNMTGPSGYEDYTFSDYFIGRNKFNEFLSRQIMIRDGAFKVRTELLSSKVGKTDDWLSSINLITTIPTSINPLSILPVKIPLKIFADVGTYAEPWRKNAELDRFLFDIGINIPLLKNTVQLYFPIFYSKIYNDYFKSTISKNRFFNTMSFSINFYTKDLRKINREIEF
jgi:hypothetical protein